MKLSFARAGAALALLALLPSAMAQAPSPSIRGVLHGSLYHLFSSGYDKPIAGDFVGASGTGKWRFGFRPDIPQSPLTGLTVPTGWGPDGLLGTGDDWPSILLHPIYTGDPTPPTLPASDLRWARPTPYPINTAPWPSTVGGAYTNSISTATAVYPDETLSFSASQWGGFFGKLRGSAGELICDGFPWSAPGADLAGRFQMVPFDRNGPANDVFHIYDLGGRPGVPASVRVLDERGRYTYNLTAPPDPTGAIPDRARGRLTLRRKSNAGQFLYGISPYIQTNDNDNTFILQGTWQIVGIEGSFLDTYGGPFKASDVGKAAGTWGQPQRYFPGVLYNDWNFQNVYIHPTNSTIPGLQKLVTYEFLTAELKLSRKYDFCGNKLCYTVTNTGDVLVRNLTITDPDLVSPVVIAGPLAPGASIEACGAASGLADPNNVAVVTTHEYFIPRDLDQQGQTGTWANGSIMAQPAQGSVFTNVPEPNPILTTASTLGTTTVIDPCVKIAGKVYCDHGPKNGAFDAGEGINGVSVTLTGTDIENNPVNVNVLTSGDGDYVFANLKPGNYKVTVDATGYLTDPAQPTAPATSTIDTEIEVPATIPGQSAYEPNNFRMCLPAKLGDTVWEDKNGNGVQDDGEPGIQGVKVELYDCADNLIDTKYTDSDGKYLFTDLEPGDYYVKFYAPSGYVFTSKDAGGDDEKDSDADPATGKTICTTLTPGEEDRSWDAGLYKPAELGDFVWEDLNANGIQDDGEPGIQGVKVDLYKSDGSLVSTQYTDGGGKYLFTDLAPGTYYVVFDKPAGYERSPVDAGGDDEKDSDANVATGKTGNYTLNSGDSNLSVDSGLYQLACLGNYVWEDLNGNGVQETGEPPIANVKVKLYKGDGTFVADMLTDSNGGYKFCDLVPGDYYVVFELPSGYLFTQKDAGGDDEKDSDADTSTGKTHTTNLSSGEYDETLDAGMLRYARVSGYVYCDENDTYAFDNGDRPLANVVVSLTGTDVFGNSVSTTATTDSNGKYAFANLVPGTYTIVVQSGVPSGSTPFAPTSHNPTLASGDVVENLNFGYDCAGTGIIKGILWCDEDRDGCVDSWEKRLAGVTVTLKDSNGNVVKTAITDANGKYIFTGLKPGTYTVEVPDPANGYKLVSQSPRTVTLPEGGIRRANFAYTGGCIKGLVYCDENNNKQWDCGEEPLKGVTVVLKDANGNVIDTDTTDCNGRYAFGCCLPAGTYTVHAPSSVNGNPINTTNPLTIVLAPGQKVTNANFGYKCKTYITYTQGGWGSKPSGNNPGMLLKNNFSRVYPANCVTIGGTKWLKFTSAAAIECFLPQGGSPGRLTASATNPTTSAAGVFAGQVLALRLNVDFSAAGILPSGLGGLVVQSGPLAGKTVNYVLSVANSVLGGGALPSGVSSISVLNDIVTKINENFNGGANLGYLK